MGNILCSLPEVYAPFHEAHKGLHESAFFSHVVRYCNHGRTEADLLAIKAIFEQSDLFRLTGLPAGPDIVALGYVTYFRRVMEQAARRHGARFWLEKTPAHTLHASFIKESFPDASIVTIARNSRDVIMSRVHGFGRPTSFLSWLKGAAVTAVYEKVIAANRLAIVRYEDLVDDYEGTVAALLHQLGIQREELPASGFRRNSSFRGEAPDLRWWQALTIWLGRGLIAVWPARLVHAGVVRWRSRRRGRLPSWFFLLRDHGAS